MTKRSSCPASQLPSLPSGGDPFAELLEHMERRRGARRGRIALAVISVGVGTALLVVSLGPVLLAGR